MVTFHKIVKEALETSGKDSEVQHKIKETALTFLLNGSYSEPKATNAQC